MADDTKEQGWALPSNSRKWHFFVDSVSLCGKWMFLGTTFEKGNDCSPDNCPGCRRKREKMPSYKVALAAQA